jgi:hypothetical protein
MDRFMPSGCSILQYADDAMVYSSHHVLQTACALVQPACSPLSVFFFAVRTHDIRIGDWGFGVFGRSAYSSNFVGSKQYCRIR